MIAREALLELPAAGQDAYRLFFDAEAKKLLEQATGPEELNKLSQIFSRFLITSVGDVAADKLGDLHFEAGNFAQAINAWRAIIEQRPDSRISRTRLRVKIGVGLAREEHWADFRDLLKIVEEQHAGEKLTLGGREVNAVDYLHSLAEKGRQSAAVAGTLPVARGPLPRHFWLVYESGRWSGSSSFFLLPTRREAKRPDSGFNRCGDRPAFPTSCPRSSPISHGCMQIFWVTTWGSIWRMANCCGAAGVSSISFRRPNREASRRSSNSAWRRDRAASGRSPAISKARVSALRTATRGQYNSRIVAREADTGKQVFSSQQATELKDWSLRGTPLLAGERVYVAAGKVNQGAALHVLALNAKEGKILWSTAIGNYTNESQSYYQVERGFQPSLLLDNGRLYVDSHSGSLVQLDAASGQIEWGLNYSSDRSGGSRFFNPWGGMRSEPYTVSPPQMVNGVLYVKGMRSRRLYAVDPQRPKVLWQRPVPRVATLIGVDDHRFYLGGEDIFGLRSGDPQDHLVGEELNLGTSYARPLITQGRIYHFASRGIYEIDKADGNVVHLFRGADLRSLGGELMLTPKALLTISNLAITAYPLGETGVADKPNTGAPAAATAVGGSAN